VNEHDEQVYRRARARVEALRAFYIHVLIYVAVNLGLFAINLVTYGGSWWFYWLLIGWGIGLASHVVVVVSGGLFGPDWEERKIKQAMEQERRRQAHRPV
jgi:hypothetical protein